MPNLKPINAASLPHRYQAHREVISSQSAENLTERPLHLQPEISANALAISPFQGRNFQSEGGRQENLLYLLQSVWGVLSGQTV